jgi:polysaccharide export outer membrane protein
MKALTRRLAVTGVLVMVAVLSVRAQRPVSTTTPPAPQELPVSMGPMLEEYLIGPEDVLDIVVWGQAELTRTVQVRPDGRISLPLINDITAAGLSPMALRANLVRGFVESETIKNAEISVMVREVHSMRVSVVGQVRTSGRFELRNRMTVLDALAMAGGLTDFAKKDRIRVQRRDGTIVMLPYDRLFDESDPRVNVVLRAGDIVIVP